jgi:hypothetical protein
MQPIMGDAPRGTVAATGDPSVWRRSPASVSHLSGAGQRAEKLF